MDDDQKFESPQDDLRGTIEIVPLGHEVTDPEEGISTANTVVPRYIAAALDNALAMILAVLAAKSVSEDLPLVKLQAMVAACLGYYLLAEGLFSRTLGNCWRSWSCDTPRRSRHSRGRLPA
jgi:hypothetical protein